MNDHCRAIARQVKEGDGSEMGGLLSLFSNKILFKNLSAELKHASLGDMVSAVAQIGDGPFKEITLNHLRALKVVVAEGDLKDAFSCQLDNAQLFLRDVFTNANYLKCLYVIMEDLWTLALKTEDEELEEEAARVINKAFTLCINDRSGTPFNKSRKLGTFRVLNMLMRIYSQYRRGQLVMCSQLVRAVRAADLPTWSDNFPSSQLATFYFFNAKFALISGRYLEAYEDMKRCLMMTCSFNANCRNVERILLYYIPLHILVNSHQQPIIRDEYSSFAAVYKDLFTNMAQGNIFGYRQAIKHHFDWIRRHELLLVFQRLEIVVIRNFLRLIYRIGSTPEAPFTKIPLQVLLSTANNAKQEKVWESELQMGSHLCCLISEKVIRGYVSFHPPYLVLSSKDPFPAFKLTCF